MYSKRSYQPIVCWWSWKTWYKSLRRLWWSPLHLLAFFVLLCVFVQMQMPSGWGLPRPLHTRITFCLFRAFFKVIQPQLDIYLVDFLFYTKICITATNFYTTFYIVTANTINAPNKETTVRYSSFLPFEDRFFSQIRNVYKPPHLNIHVT